MLEDTIKNLVRNLRNFNPSISPPEFSKPVKRIHFLKTVDPYFFLVSIGAKTHELRFNDRNFQENDYLILEEYDPNFNSYSGDFVIARITNVLSSFEGLTKGWVDLSISTFTPSRANNNLDFMQALRSLIMIDDLHIPVQEKKKAEVLYSNLKVFCKNG